MYADADVHDYGFEGKVVLITGASSGIGAATAIHFARLGASLSLTGRNGANLASVAKECAANNGSRDDRILTTVADVTSYDDLHNLVARTLSQYGAIHVLVNNAGTLMRDADMLHGSIEQFDSLSAVNVRSVIQLSQLCLEALKATRGCVVNVSSAAALAASPYTFYSMGKAGINQFTKNFALEMAPYGVRVNAVNPAGVRTEIFSRSGVQAASDAVKDFFDKIAGNEPLGRVAEPEEVALAIAHLAHHRLSAWTTGILLPIDGGILLANPFSKK